MRRKLLIITNSNTLGTVTAAVNCAADRMQSYFQSPGGGAWDPNTEISRIDLSSYPIPNDKLKTEIRDLNESYDYSLVLFIGHGARSEFSYDYVQTSPLTAIPVNEFCYGLATEEQKRNIRRTVIIDSCRSFLSQSSIAGMLTESQLRDDLDVNECRDFFNAQVMSIPPRIDLIQSTQPFNFAYCLADSTKFIDGISQFLNKNLHSFKKLAMSDAGYCFSNRLMLSEVRSIIGREQIPTISPDSEPSFPFFAARRPTSKDKPTKEIICD